MSQIDIPERDGTQPGKWREMPFEIPTNVIEAARRGYIRSCNDERPSRRDSLGDAIEATLQAALKEWGGDRPYWLNGSEDSRLAWYENRVKELEASGAEAAELAAKLHDLLPL